MSMERHCGAFQTTDLQMKFLCSLCANCLLSVYLTRKLLPRGRHEFSSKTNVWKLFDLLINGPFVSNPELTLRTLHQILRVQILFRVPTASHSRGSGNLRIFTWAVPAYGGPSICLAFLKQRQKSTKAEHFIVF